ncbi:MAG: hypothetical protein Q4B01_09980 [Eubacteriales bacterium]|nr:hypothetical protein [Eubacteriales bacterium]
MPYIKKRMTGKELEDFLEHMESCPVCREELEVYYTIYYALEKLDQNEPGTYNMQEKLRQELKHSQEYVERENLLHFVSRILKLVGVIALVIGAVTVFEYGLRGSMEGTTVYRMILGSAEEYEGPSNASDLTEEYEQETNRKKQVIVRTPETEAVLRETGVDTAPELEGITQKEKETTKEPVRTHERKTITD